MSTGNLSPAAERLLAAAMDLFAQKGYAGTSVGEIQEAAGLTFGSGALYKHFPSKEAVLAVGIERFVEHARTERESLAALNELPVPDALTAIGRSAMTSFARDADALRIAWRDLEPFPALQEKVRTEQIRATYDEFAVWLGRQAAEGRVPEHDCDALAAVALSSLAFFQLLHFLLHDTPGGVDEERFVAAWSALFTAALTGTAEREADAVVPKAPPQKAKVPKKPAKRR
jgi:AcrR family transcriptional regulator